MGPDCERLLRRDAEAELRLEGSGRAALCVTKQDTRKGIRIRNQSKEVRMHTVDR